MSGEDTHRPALPAPPPAAPLTHEDDNANGAQDRCEDEPADTEPEPV